MKSKSIGPWISIGYRKNKKTSYKELLEASKKALALLDKVQLDIDGIGAIPWPEIDELKIAIDRAEGK